MLGMGEKEEEVGRLGVDGVAGVEMGDVRGDWW